ncbi:MAG: hypothetical protein Q8R26_01970 [bacterium]|nr:hypothetical protein [bacterium]
MLWKIKNGEKLKGGYEIDLLLVATNLILATSGVGAFAVPAFALLFSALF